jgi:hypothetical protein
MVGRLSGAGEQRYRKDSDLELRARHTEVKERVIAASPVGRANYNELKGPFLSAVKAGLK